MPKSTQNGLKYMLLASFCFSLSAACTRILGHHISSLELVFFRNLIGVIFITASIFRKPLQQTGGRFGLLMFRGFVGSAALLTFFFSIIKIGLAEAISYQQSYPVLLSILAFIFFSEKIKAWVPILMGFGGLCCIFVPQFNLNNISAQNHALGLLNTILTAFAYLSIKGLSKYYDGRAIVASFMIWGLLLPTMVWALSYQIEFFAIFGHNLIIPNNEDWKWILLLAVSAMVGQIYLTKAFSQGITGEISAIGYSNIVFTIFFGIILGDKLPSVLSFLGILMIVISGVTLALSKKD